MKSQDCKDSNTIQKDTYVGGAIENFVIIVTVMNWNFCTQNSSVVKPRHCFCSVYKRYHEFISMHKSTGVSINSNDSTENFNFMFAVEQNMRVLFN